MQSAAFQSQRPAQSRLLDLERRELESFFAEQGEKAFRASQILKWVHQQGITDFAQMSNLSKSLRLRLQEQADLSMPVAIKQQNATDGTRKWLLQLDGGNCIETVFIPETDRATLCISSQVGCALNCSFCSTAQQGFNRNLSTAEIISQVWLAEHSLRKERENALRPLGPSGRIVSNVVLMGMGEPLLNYNNVVKAMRIMMDDFAYGLSRRRITLSTAGVIPALERLREDCPVSLAVSLHAVNDELRDELVPLNKKYPIADLLAACKRYVEGESRRKITFEYVLLDGINDSAQEARALLRLLRGLPAKVNLIPFNPFPQTRYQCSPPDRIERFRDVLMQAGLITTTRKTRGDDIDAACGQLAGSVQDRSRRHGKQRQEGMVS